MLLGLRSLWETGAVVAPVVTPGVPKPRKNVVVKVTGVQADAAVGNVTVFVTPATRFAITGVQSFAGIGTPRINVVARGPASPMPATAAIGNVRAITITDLLDDEIAAILG
jgi:hypothetical protein